MYTLNCWIAAKVAHASEHFVRPWPNLRETALPQMALVALSVAIAFSFSGGLFGILALTVASALLTAYAIVGFAVLHTVTLSSSSRPLWLGLAYAITLLSAFTVVAASLLGIADAVFGLRQRYLRGRPPPLPVS
jgi:hypothetical protein